MPRWDRVPQDGNPIQTGNREEPQRELMGREVRK